MTLSQDYDQLINYISTNWTQTPVSYPNEDFDKPENPKEPWMRVSINEGEINRAEIGNNGIHRQLGLINLQIFIPAGTGTGNLSPLVEDARSLLTEKTFGDIRIDSPRESRPGKNRGWFGHTMKFPYERDKNIT